MIIDKSIIEMYEKTRTEMFKEELQKKTSDLQSFAQVIGGCNGKMYQLPLVGSTSINYRKERKQKIESDELKYARRNMRPNLFEKFLSWSTDDEKFLANLPINATMFVRQLGYAVERLKDNVLLGTVYDSTLSDYIVQPSGYSFTNAVDGSPYKAGTTGGLMGDNYVGEAGTEKVALPQKPYVKGTGLSTTYTGEADTPIDGKKTNVIPVNFTGEKTVKNSGLTIAKVLRVKRCFQERHALNNGQQLCMAITPAQQEELIKEDKLQNSLYGFQALLSGNVNSLLGIRFIVTEAVPLVSWGSGYVRACPVWRSEDLIYGIWENARFHMRQPDDYIDELLVGVTFGMGAARVREESVISVHCDEGLLGEDDTTTTTSAK